MLLWARRVTAEKDDVYVLVNVFTCVLESVFIICASGDWGMHLDPQRGKRSRDKYQIAKRGQRLVNRSPNQAPKAILFPSLLFYPSLASLYYPKDINECRAHALYISIRGIRGFMVLPSSTCTLIRAGL